MSAPIPSAPIPSSQRPLQGLWRPVQLQQLYYGPTGTVSNYLLKCLPTPTSKAFIITGASLANKTPLIKEVEVLLGVTHHAGTFSKINAHVPVQDVNAATKIITADPSIDTIISIGGGSPIDSAKNISHRIHEQGGDFLFHISIPTTLSAAETTWIGGFTKPDGLKAVVIDPNLSPKVIIYDAGFAKYTPPKLWLSTGLRALDHAVEMLYHPSATEMPCRIMCLSSATALFENLPKNKIDPDDEDTLIKLFLASYGSLGFLGLNLLGGLGLSHALGYALGSPYGIGHGMTSCLTLGKVVKLKAQLSESDATQIARLLPFINADKDMQNSSGLSAATRVGDMIEALVEELGLNSTLTEYGVSRSQIPIVANLALVAISAAAADGRKVDPDLASKVEKLVESLY